MIPNITIRFSVYVYRNKKFFPSINHSNVLKRYKNCPGMIMELRLQVMYNKVINQVEVFVVRMQKWEFSWWPTFMMRLLYIRQVQLRARFPISPSFRISRAQA